MAPHLESNDAGEMEGVKISGLGGEHIVVRRLGFRKTPRLMVLQRDANFQRTRVMKCFIGGIGQAS
ncbi:hypothetical protein D3C83_94360 [compost metagenome]